MRSLTVGRVSEWPAAAWLAMGMRRWGKRTVCLAGWLAAWAVCLGAAAEGLPVGSAPAPLVPEHLPDRAHAFIFRNWNLVTPARMARVLGTTEETVRQRAAAMGLPRSLPLPEDQLRRVYITLLRRNWHLLPYDQLLQLVDMSEEQLAQALLEDDFLWIKFGGLKPACEPLRYTAPDLEVGRRVTAVREALERHLGSALEGPSEARFDFVKVMSNPPPGPEPSPRPADREGELFQLRYIYSYFGLFGDPLMNPDLDPYPEGLLVRLARVGVDGVWMHVVLRNLAPGGEVFPEFGKGHETRLANLRALAQRAARHGIGIYLYLNEPRAMPRSFFESRPELAGAAEGDLRAFCTSQPAVREWLRKSLTYVFEKVPELAGVFTITASENLTSCVSHGRQGDCPRCRERSYADLIAEVNGVIAAGVHAAQPGARVLAWDWGWHGHGDAADVIERLPEDIWLLSVSEWALPIERGGIATQVGEYCLSAVGPGPRAQRHWELARARGLSTAAKVQLNCTWELAALPYLPVFDLVAEHCRRLASAQVSGMMLSWSLGSSPSPNLEVARRFSARPVPTVEAVLDGLARERFGEKGAARARQAWSAFSRALQEYPYAGSVVYNAPVQMGPANLLYPRKTGYAATMTGIPYDDLNGWRGPYPAEVFAAQFQAVADGWGAGLGHLAMAVAEAPSATRAEVEAELRYARAAWLHFQSVANQARFVWHRDARTAGQGDPEGHRAAMKKIAEEELDLARQLYALAQADSRIGFEAANQYFYVPMDLAEKVVNCDYLLRQWSQ